MAKRHKISAEHVGKKSRKKGRSKKHGKKMHVKK